MNTGVIYYAVKHDLIPLLFCFQIVALYLRVTAISAITKISRINLFICNRHGLLLLQFFLLFREVNITVPSEGMFAQIQLI
jgi:hypothetical protein